MGPISSRRTRCDENNPSEIDRAVMTLLRPRAVLLHAVILLVLWAPYVSAASTSIIDAAKNHDTNALGRLISEGADVNVRYGDGSTALHWAVYWRDAEAVGLLIRARADVNAASDLGVRPLALASANGDLSIINALLAAHADPNVATEAGVTPLMEAARAGHALAVAQLLKHGAGIDAAEHTHNQTALMWAASERHADVVRVLLKSGANVSLKSRSGQQTVLVRPATDAGEARSVKTVRDIGVQVATGGASALMFAAWSGDLQSASVLIEAGARVNEPAADGTTPLIAAVHGGFTALALHLLDHGADPNAGDTYSALHVAALRADESVTRALLAHGADPNRPLTRGMPVRRFGLEWVIPGTWTGASPLLVAASFLDVKVMTALLSGGADPNAAMDDGTTPLLATIGVGPKLSRPPVSADEQVCINSAGFAVTCTDADLDTQGGGTPEGSSASPAGDDRVLAAARLLIDGGADVNAANRQGDTALHGAAVAGLERVIRLLIQSGASVDARNARGRTPLGAAVAATSGGEASPLKKKISGAADALRALGAHE